MVFAEMNLNQRATPERGTVYGLGGERSGVLNPERPGEFCFPPFATVITGGARLMLAMLQREVEDAGTSLIFSSVIPTRAAYRRPATETRRPASPCCRTPKSTGSGRSSTG